MHILFIIIAIIAAVFLIFAVLLQKSKKEGGIDPLASGSTQIMGITKSLDILEKATWTLAFVVAASSVFSTLYLKKNLKRKFSLESPNVKAAQERSMLYRNQNQNQDQNNKGKK